MALITREMLERAALEVMENMRIYAASPYGQRDRAKCEAAAAERVRRYAFWLGAEAEGA